MKYLSIFLQKTSDFFGYFVHEVANPSWTNYFYWLIALSLFCWGLEILYPWRKDQNALRKDFWLDGFYMFFNFFFFSMIGFYGVSNVFSELFNDFLALFGIHNLISDRLSTFPYWASLLLLFVLKDFIQWNIHRLLHRVPFLWEFHKVHHSVKEMGFAAHLRYHWMENVVYKTIQYIPLGMLGYGLKDFFLMEIVATAIGHLNHTNFYLPIGPLKYIFNSPQMHLWHHAKYIPSPFGINFGISLSIWDYLFGTAHFPKEDENLELGFDDEDKLPQDFFGQILYPFAKPKRK
ncbi:MAG: sterol desaturase family protein [Bacteroidia bacterium]